MSITHMLFCKNTRDIRVLYKKESPYFDLQASFHEPECHACSSIGAIMSIGGGRGGEWVWQRGGGAIFLEGLVNTANMSSSLSDSIKDKNTLDKLASRNRFMELFFFMVYAANSLMKMESEKKPVNRLGIESMNG